MRPGTRNQRGVSLIELMVTLIVLAVAIAIAAPSFTGYRQRQAVKAAAEEYVSLMAEQRMEAVKRNEVRAIDFRTVAARLPAAAVVGTPTMTDGGEAGVVRIDPKRGILANTSTPGGIVVQVGDYQLRFNVNRVGRPSVCRPSSAQSIPGYPVCGA
jgi:prepilin-type N-terminal cleavage/methylation domain-containing protein